MSQMKKLWLTGAAREGLTGEPAQGGKLEV